MSATTGTEADADHGHHPTPREYVKVALILAVLTGLEVSTYFVDFGRVAIPLLVVLMVVKFLYVAGWFMHLRFDSRWFSILMYAGLSFALVLYVITVVLVLLGHTAWLA